MVPAQAFQRLTELRPARKIFNQRIGMVQHGVGVAQSECAAQIRQLRPEGKHLALLVLPGGGMQESQQQTRIALHRPRYIHQHQQRQRLRTALALGQVQHLAAQTDRLPHQAGPMQLVTPATGAHAAAGHLRQGQSNIPRQPLHQPVLGGRQRVEIRVAQALHIAGGHGGVEVHLLVFAGRFGLVAHLGLWREGLTHAGAALAGLGLALGAGQHLRQQLVRHVGVAEKCIEQFAKNRAVLLTADQHGFQRGAQVIAVMQTHRHGGLC